MKNNISIIIGLILCSSLFWGLSVSAAVKEPVLEYDHGSVTLNANKVSLMHLLERLAYAAHIEIYIPDEIKDYTGPIEFEKMPLQDALSILLKEYSFAVIYTKGSETKTIVSLNEDSNFSELQIASGRQNDAVSSLGIQDSSSRKMIAADHSISNSDQGHGYTPVDGESRYDQLPGHQVSMQAQSVSYPHDEGAGAISSSVGAVSHSGSTASFDVDSEDNELSETLEHEPDVLADSNTSENVDIPNTRIIELEHKIQLLEEDIQSGKAQEFYDFWSQKKDPKYIYNHWNELSRLQTELETLQAVN